MPYPYTPLPLDAFLAAQVSLAIVLSAVLWFRPLRPWPATLLFGAAIWLITLSPIEPDLLRGLGAHLAPTHTVWLFRFATVLATLAVAIARPHWIVLPAIAGEWALSKLCDWVVDGNLELASLHLVWFGALLGLQAWRAVPGKSAPLPIPSSARRGTDLALFFGATFLAALVATYVLFRSPGSGDEWANLYMADIFGHLHAYGPVPHCSPLFQTFWVFFYMGRSFCQYTPGWPLLMAPFQRLGIAWLANPVVLGVLAVGVARLTRRAVAAGIGGVARVSELHVRAGGIVAALTATLGASMLLNAGSQYPHPVVAAGFAWAIESAAAMSAAETDPRAKWKHGLVLGVATSIMVSARPGEGGLLGIGIFLFFVYALVRRRFGWKPLVATAATFTLIAGLTLIILRLQLGVWLKTGYSITPLFHAWAKLDIKPAQPNEVKHVLPLGTGAYMWWPAAPALGAAGLLAMRARGRGIAFMLVSGPLVLLGLFFYTGFTHAPATGYGPRFHLPMVVSMAVGTGVLLAPLWAAAQRRGAVARAIATGGPAAIAALAMILGVARIAPLVYLPAWTEMHKKTAPLRAIRAAHLHHAVVTVTRGETYADPLDLLQNYASDFPDPDVIILHKWNGPEQACGRERWADREWWHASGMEEGTLRRD